jgi:hypothetical protein
MTRSKYEDFICVECERPMREHTQEVDDTTPRYETEGEPPQVYWVCPVVEK